MILFSVAIAMKLLLLHESDIKNSSLSFHYLQIYTAIKGRSFNYSSVRHYRLSLSSQSDLHRGNLEAIPLRRTLIGEQSQEIDCIPVHIRKLVEPYPTQETTGITSSFQGRSQAKCPSSVNRSKSPNRRRVVPKFVIPQRPNRYSIRLLPTIQRSKRICPIDYISRCEKRPGTR
jgi:hypothetical protein